MHGSRQETSALFLDQLVPLEPPPACTLPKDPRAAAWNAQHTAMVTSTESSSSSAETLTRLLRHLFETNSAAIGVAIFSSSTGTVNGTSSGSGISQPVCLSVVLMAHGKDKASLVILDTSSISRVPADARPTATATATGAHDLALAAEPWLAATGPAAAASREAGRGRERERPAGKKVSASRSLLQLAANTQGGATRESLHMDDGGSMSGLPLRGGGGLGGVLGGASGRLMEQSAASLLVAASPPDYSLDYSMSVFPDGGASVMHDLQAAAGSAVIGAEGGVNGGDSGGDGTSGAGEGLRKGGLFQSVMDGAVRAQGSPPKLGAASRSSASGSTSLAQPEQGLVEPVVHATPAATVTASSAPQVSVLAPSSSSSSSGSVIPTAPLLSDDEDKRRVQLVVSCLNRPSKKAKGPVPAFVSALGSSERTHCLQRHTAFRSIIDECLLSREASPAAAASRYGSLLKVALASAGASKSDVALAKVLTAYRRSLAALTVLGAARIRGSRGFGSAVGTSCVLAVLLSLQLVSAQATAGKRAFGSKPGQEVWMALQKDSEKAGTAVSTAVERLALVLVPGVLQEEDVFWLLRLSVDDSADSTASRDKPAEVSILSSGAGNDDASRPSVNVDESGLTARAGADGLTSPGAGATGLDPVLPSVTSLLAHCRAVYSQCAACLNLLDKAAADLGISSSEDGASPLSQRSPLASKRKHLSSTSEASADNSKASVEKNDAISNKRQRPNANPAENGNSPLSSASGNHRSAAASSSERDKDRGSRLDKKDKSGHAYSKHGNSSTKSDGAGSEGPAVAMAASAATTLRRTNSILVAKPKAAVSQRTNNAPKRQVSVGVTSEKPKESGLSRKTGEQMPPPLPPAKQQRKQSTAHHSAPPQTPRGPSSIGGAGAMIPDTPYGYESCDRSTILSTPVGPPSSNSASSRGYIPETPGPLPAAGGGYASTSSASTREAIVPRTPLQSKAMHSPAPMLLDRGPGRSLLSKAGHSARGGIGLTKKAKSGKLGLGVLSKVDENSGIIRPHTAKPM